MFGSFATDGPTLRCIKLNPQLERKQSASFTNGVNEKFLTEKEFLILCREFAIVARAVDFRAAANAGGLCVRGGEVGS